MKYFAILTIIFALAGCGPSFTDDDIIHVQQSMGQDYIDRAGVQGVHPEMIRESRRKLTGFIQVTMENGTVSKIPCSAVMDSDGKHLWTCG